MRPSLFDGEAHPVNLRALRSGANTSLRTTRPALRLVPAAPPPPSDDLSDAASPLKRGVDVLGSAVALLICLPVMVIVALLISLTDSGDVFFAQERLGKGGKRFRCLKFRTMATNADVLLDQVLATDPEARREWHTTQKLRCDPRVTRVGKFLRASSLDELPQLLNVLKGDMSLVGPRPIVPGEDEKYGRYIRDYYRVKPGVTGLWQISGRSKTTYRRRVALDVTYVRRNSPSLDLWIMAHTLPACLRTGETC